MRAIRSSWEATIDPIIKLRDVSRVFGGPQPIIVLHDLSLEILAGEYVAVMGRSGSGKSTLLNILGLLDRPTDGEYLLNGRNVSSLAERERDRLRAAHIGFVFQVSHVLNARSALENVEIGLDLAGVRRAVRTELAASALIAVGLEHRLHASVSTLSGGERQRVAIARAIAKESDLLLCDEPTGDLDSTTAAEVLDIIQMLRTRKPLTVVMITHDAEVATRAERTVRILDGAIV